MRRVLLVMPAMISCIIMSAADTTVTIDPILGNSNVLTATAAGQVYHVTVMGTVNLVSQDGTYDVDANGVIIIAPLIGSNTDGVITNMTDPVGVPKMRA